jgi:crossover junction endodeoxyribonuclease RuvC
MIKVIGIDPGLADTGIGIVRGTGVTVHGFAYGNISTSKADPVAADWSRFMRRPARYWRTRNPTSWFSRMCFPLKNIPSRVSF